MRSCLYKINKPIKYSNSMNPITHTFSVMKCTSSPKLTGVCDGGTCFFRFSPSREESTLSRSSDLRVSSRSVVSRRRRSLMRKMDSLLSLSRSRSLSPVTRGDKYNVKIKQEINTMSKTRGVYKQCKMQKGRNIQ